MAGERRRSQTGRRPGRGHLTIVAKLPGPPPHLPKLRAGDVNIVKAGAELWRIYFAGGAYPDSWNQFRFYGPRATARFDHHVSPAHVQRRGIMYAGLDGPTCFAEAFQSTRRIHRTRRSPWLTSFTISRDLKLLDLRGSWPTRAGASQAINSGPRSRAREWAARIYGDYSSIQGLIYPSSMYGGRDALALFERGSPSIPSHPQFHAPLTHPGLKPLIANVAISMGYGVI